MYIPLYYVRICFILHIRKNLIVKMLRTQIVDAKFNYFLHRKKVYTAERIKYFKVYF